MSRRDDYPAGVPCFVDTLTADVEAAKAFYGGIFGWEFAGPGPMPGDPPGDYYVAQVDGDDVAGVGARPAQSGDGVPAAWNTHVAVQSADDDRRPGHGRRRVGVGRAVRRAAGRAHGGGRRPGGRHALPLGGRRPARRGAGQ